MPLLGTTAVQSLVVGDRDITLIGHILPPETRAAAVGDGDEEDSESEEPEESQPEFLDMSEMMQAGGGGHMFQSAVRSRDEGM